MTFRLGGGCSIRLSYRDMHIGRIGSKDSDTYPKLFSNMVFGLGDSAQNLPSVFSRILIVARSSFMLLLDSDHRSECPTTSTESFHETILTALS